MSSSRSSSFNNSSLNSTSFQCKLLQHQNITIFCFVYPGGFKLWHMCQSEFAVSMIDVSQSSMECEKEHLLGGRLLFSWVCTVAAISKFQAEVSPICFSFCQTSQCICQNKQMEGRSVGAWTRKMKTNNFGKNAKCQEKSKKIILAGECNKQKLIGWSFGFAGKWLADIGPQVGD